MLDVGIIYRCSRSYSNIVSKKRKLSERNVLLQNNILSSAIFSENNLYNKDNGKFSVFCYVLRYYTNEKNIYRFFCRNPE